MNRSRFSYHRILSQLRRLLRNDHLILSVLGGVIGCLTGAAIILFRGNRPVNPLCLSALVWR